MCLDVCCVLCIPSGVVLVRYYGPNSETWFFKKNLGFFKQPKKKKATVSQGIYILYQF